MNVVSFGDRPAGAITMTALRNTAKLSETEFLEPCNTILKNIYVDDILDSIGDVPAAKKLTNEIDYALSKGSFKVKGWTIGKSNEEIFKMDLLPDEEESHRVLGMNWNPSTDTFFFKVKINFPQKVKVVRKGVESHESEVTGNIPRNLTKRQILSKINGFFDPMGIGTAFTVKAKILWRELWIGEAKGLSWDDQIPESQWQDWTEFFNEMYEMQHLRFYRCMKPPNVKDIEPILILFSDASNKAYGSCAYIRWELTDGTFSSRLVAAKSKICPLKVISTVRGEMNGALLSKRLKCFIDKELRLTFQKVYLLVDSQIVYSMIQRDSYVFSTFIGLRVGEIQRSTELTSSKNSAVPIKESPTKTSKLNNLYRKILNKH